MFGSSDTMKVKICLVGEGAVGKTSLIRKYVLDEFDDRYISTLGAKITKKELMVESPDNGSEIRIDMTIWDIMGEKGFRELLKEAYFHGAQGVLAVCDVTRKNTLPDLESWISAIETVTGKLPIQFLANKADLKDQLTFTEGELREMSAKHKSPYIFTSAKTGENVDKAFFAIADAITKRRVA
ncbi:MAG: GTP-binding protein [Candidatus Thermoplasmatota archaeon]|nr:GTP-binding protein [Candidatus Thermoplasmatota archaeon]